MARRKRYYQIKPPTARRGELAPVVTDDDLRKQSLADRLRARITLPHISIQHRSQPR